MISYINSLTHYTKGTPSHLDDAPTACKHWVSESFSLPSTGFFSPFPHGTRSLSVTKEYLGLEGGPPFFRQDFTCPALLMILSVRSPYRAITFFSRAFQLSSGCTHIKHWPDPLSLATTHGVSVDFLSSG